MRKLFLISIAPLLLSLAVFAQTNNAPTQNSPAQTAAPKKRPPIFRATKDQVLQTQKMLKLTESGKLDGETRAAVKAFQSANGLKATGTLNRATLEKMNVALTDKQREIPVSAGSFASADNKTRSTTGKTRGAVFRATREQIMQAQRTMKERALYSGAETGKLDDATREGLKKFQSANNVKVTGTLNRETLERMGIGLTDKQKEMN